MALSCLVLVIGCGGDKEKKSGGDKSVREELAGSKVKLAKAAADRLAKEAFPRWSIKHADKACPDSLSEVATDIGLSKDDTIDPWGAPYKMLCGESLPPGVKGFAVMSLGEDGKEGTADDVKSWER
jgi:hypothetical protein